MPMVADEPLDRLTREQPTGVRATSRPPPADQEAGLDPPAQDDAVVDPEQALHVTQAQVRAPARSRAALETRDESRDAALDAVPLLEASDDLGQLAFAEQRVDEGILLLRPAPAGAAAAAGAAAGRAALLASSVP
jgi:hypothetical protein